MTFFRKLVTAFEGITIAFDAIMANKGRAALTIMGVGVGVFVVVALSSVIQGINESFRKDLEAAGPTSFYVYRRPLNAFQNCPDADACPERRNPGITMDEVAGLARLPNMFAVVAHVGNWPPFPTCATTANMFGSRASPATSSMVMPGFRRSGQASASGQFWNAFSGRRYT